MQEQIKGEFHVSDAQLGSLTFWFLMVYMCASPFTGWLGDHFPRKPMIVAAAIFWSTVNLLTGYVHTFNELNFRHAALGLGEATFGIFAPGILADFYPQDQRNRVLTIFNIAVPVGAAMGFAIGGFVGQHYGWRMSFTVSAIPGIIIALLIALFMAEPKRKEEDKTKVEKQAVLGLLKNPAYLCAVGGYAMVTFTVGGLSFWMPGFLQRANQMTQSSASFAMGAITVAGGLLGTIAGGTIAQRWSKTNPAALYLVPAWSGPPRLLPSRGLLLRPLAVPHQSAHPPVARPRHLPRLPRLGSGQRGVRQLGHAGGPVHRTRRPALHDPRPGRRSLPHHHRRHQRPLQPLRRPRRHPRHAPRRCRHLLPRRALRPTPATRTQRLVAPLRSEPGTCLSAPSDCFAPQRSTEAHGFSRGTAAPNAHPTPERRSLQPHRRDRRRRTTFAYISTRLQQLVSSKSKLPTS